MPAITIRVGAALDASMQNVMKPWIASVKTARGQVEKEMSASAKSTAALAKAGAKAEADASKAIISIAEAEAKAKAKAREYVFQIKQRYLKEEAAAEAAAAKASASAWTSNINRLSASARSSFSGIMSSYKSTFGSVLRGAGVNFDVGSNIGSAVQTQRSAALLSNKGFLEGAEGMAGQRQDPSTLMREAGVAADATAHSTNEMVGAMTKFVESSGDLEVARNMIADIGKVSNATGADIGTMGEVAGRLDLKLKTTMKSAADRQKVIADTMRVFAAQGKTGAIDIEQLAPQIPKLIAGAGKLGMSATSAFQTAGIAAQISASSGGSSSAAMAARSVNALLELMGKSQNGFLGPAKAGAKTGTHVGVFSDESRTKLRDPLVVMSELVSSTKGDLSKLSMLIPNVRANSVATGLQSIYTNAGGGAAGDAAMKAAIKEYTSAVMTQDEVDKENAVIMQTTAAKAQIFQNQLERIAGVAADRIIPALERWEPEITKLVQEFADVASWAAENPGSVIVAAIVGSIAKAAIGEAVGGALKSLISGNGMPGGLLGTAGLTLALGSAMIAVESAIVNEKRAEGADAAKGADAEIAYHLKRAGAQIATGGGVDDDTRKQLESDLAAAQARAKAAGEYQGGNYGTAQLGRSLDVVKNALGLGGASLAEQGKAQFDKANMGLLAEEIKGISAALAALKPKGGVQDVRVTNPPLPGVSPEHRTGPPGTK